MVWCEKKTLHDKNNMTNESPSRTNLVLRSSNQVPPPVELPPSPHPLDVLRQSAERLAEDERISKEAALQIMRLFHDMENLLHEECVQRDMNLAEYKFQIERLKMTLRHYEEANRTEPPKRKQSRW